MSERVARSELGGDVWIRPDYVDPEDAESKRRKAAMIVSVLLFVAIYVWGFIWGVQSLSSRASEDSALS
jgi:hypothetical protein